MPPKKATSPSKKPNPPKTPAGVGKKSSTAKSKSAAADESTTGGGILSTIFGSVSWSGSKGRTTRKKSEKSEKSEKSKKPDEPEKRVETTENPIVIPGTNQANNPRFESTIPLTEGQRARLLAARLDALTSRQRAVENYKTIASMTPNLIFDMDVDKDSEEYQKQRRRLRDRLHEASILEVLDSEFTPSQKHLLTPQIWDGPLVELQKRNTTAYKAALNTEFSGEKDNISTKFAMAKFGLPVEPMTRSNIDKLAQYIPGDESDDDDPDDTNAASQFERITYSEKPLEFLEGYEERSYGYPTLRPQNSRLGLRGGAGGEDDDDDEEGDDSLMTLYSYNGVYSGLTNVNQATLCDSIMDLLNLHTDCNLAIDLIEYKQDGSFKIMSTTNFPYVHGVSELTIPLFSTKKERENTKTYLTEHYCDQTHWNRAFFIRRSTTLEPLSITPPSTISQDVIVLSHDDIKSYWKVAANFQGEIGFNQTQSHFLRAVSRLRAEGGNFTLEKQELGYESHEAPERLWTQVIDDINNLRRLIEYTLVVKQPIEDYRPLATSPAMVSNPFGLHLIGHTNSEDLFSAPDNLYSFWNSSNFKEAYDIIYRTIFLTTLTTIANRNQKHARIWSSRQSRELDGPSLLISLQASYNPEAVRQIADWDTDKRHIDPYNAHRVPVWEYRVEFETYTIIDSGNQSKRTFWRPGTQPTLSSFRTALRQLYSDFDNTTSFMLSFSGDRNKFVCPSGMDEREWRLFTFDWIKIDRLFVQKDYGDEYVYAPTTWGYDYDESPNSSSRDASLAPPIDGRDPFLRGSQSERDSIAASLAIQKAAQIAEEQRAKDEANAEAQQRQKEKQKRQQQREQAIAAYNAAMAADSVPGDPQQASRNAAEVRRILTSGTSEERAKWYSDKAKADKVFADAEIAFEGSDSETIDDSVPKFRVTRKKYVKPRAQEPAPITWTDWQREETWRNSLRQKAYTRDLSVVEYGIDSVAAQFGDFREMSIFAGHSLPSVYHQHWSQTEIRKLLEENQTLKNASLSRTSICPICNAQFSGFDEEKKILHFNEHFKQVLNGGKCPLCDSARFATFSIQERKDHLLSHQADFKRRTAIIERNHLDCPICHVNLSYDEFPGVKGVIEHLGEHVPDLYKFCDRCGTSLHEIEQAAEDHHDQWCTYESYPEGKQQPELLWPGGQYRFCKECGDEHPPHSQITDGQYLTMHSNTCGKDGIRRHDIFCGTCGLSMFTYNADAKSQHAKGCKQPGGFQGKFCRMCGAKWEELRADAQLFAAHYGNCRYQRPFWLLGHEFTERRMKLKYKDQWLSHREERLDEAEKFVESGLQICPFCNVKLPDLAIEQQDHFNTYHLSRATDITIPIRLYKTCPVCQDQLRMVRTEQDAHFASHRASTTTGDPVLPKCVLCNDTLENCSEYQKKHYQAHTVLKTCPLCKEELQDCSETQKKHFEAHAKGLLPTCPLCNEALKACEKTQKEHFETHTKALLPKCHLCNKALTSCPDTQKAHFDIHAKSLLPKCPLCNEALTACEDSQRTHFETHVKGLFTKCPVCDEALKPSADIQKTHFDTHAKGLLQNCPICDEALEACENSQANHFKTHLPIKIRCPYCSEGLANSSTVQSDHLKYRHDTKQSIACQICVDTEIRPKSIQEHFKQHMMKLKHLVVVQSDESFFTQQVGSIVQTAIEKANSTPRYEMPKPPGINVMEAASTQLTKNGRVTSSKTSGTASKLSYDQLLAQLDKKKIQNVRQLSRSPAKSQRTKQVIKFKSSSEDDDDDDEEEGEEEEDDDDDDDDDDEDDTIRVGNAAKKSHLIDPTPDMSFQPTVESDSEIDPTPVSPRKRGRPRALNPPSITPARRSTRSVSATPSVTTMPPKRTASTRIVEEVEEEDEEENDTSGTVDDHAPPPKRTRRSPAKKYTR